MNDRRQTHDKGHMEKLAEDTIVCLAIFALTISVAVMADMLLHARGGI